MLTSREYKELEKRLQEVICPHCIERDVHQQCRLWPRPAECPMLLHLQRVVAIAEAIDSDQMSDYLEPVRKNVCAACENVFSPTGACALRDQGHCALDAYLPLILEVIDGFLARNDEGRAR